MMAHERKAQNETCELVHRVEVVAYRIGALKCFSEHSNELFNWAARAPQYWL